MLVGAIGAGILGILVYFWWTRWGGGGRFGVFTDHERATRRFVQQRAEWLASARTDPDRELLLRAFWEMRYREALKSMAYNNEPLKRVDAVRFADRELEFIRRRFEREQGYDGPEF